MRSIKSLLKEEPATLMSPAGDDDLSKAIRVKEALKHKVLSLTLEDILRNPSLVETLDDTIYTARTAIGKVEDKLMDADKDDLASQVADCAHELVILGLFLMNIGPAAEKAKESYNNLNFEL